MMVSQLWGPHQAAMAELLVVRRWARLRFSPLQALLSVLHER
jgi:hypothetical protein